MSPRPGKTQRLSETMNLSLRHGKYAKARGPSPGPSPRSLQGAPALRGGPSPPPRSQQRPPRRDPVRGSAPGPQASPGSVTRDAGTRSNCSGPPHAASAGTGCPEPTGGPSRVPSRKRGAGTAKPKPHSHRLCCRRDTGAPGVTASAEGFQQNVPKSRSELQRVCHGLGKEAA